MDASTRLAHRCRWADVVLNCALQMIPPGPLSRSLLCDGTATDSEFTGRAAAWKVAARFLKMPVHKFQDVRSIWKGPHAAERAFQAQPSYDAKVEWAHAAACHKTAWCDTHGGYCALHTGASSRVGGFPCTDFSAAGLRQTLNGPMLSTVFAYGAKFRATRTPCIVIENVPQCSDFLIKDAFGDSFEWHIDQVVQPQDVGFSWLSRNRT